MSSNRRLCFPGKGNIESDQENSSYSASNETDKDSVHIPVKCTPLTDSQKQVKKNSTFGSRVGSRIRTSSIETFIARSEYRDLTVGFSQVLSKKNRNPSSSSNRCSNRSLASTNSFRSYNSNPSSEFSLPSVFSPLPPRNVQVQQNVVQRRASESSRSYNFSFSYPPSESSHPSVFRPLLRQNVRVPPNEVPKDESVSSRSYNFSFSYPPSESSLPSVFPRQNVRVPPNEVPKDESVSSRSYNFSFSNPSSESEGSVSSVIRPLPPLRVKIPLTKFEENSFESSRWYSFSSSNPSSESPGNISSVVISPSTHKVQLPPNDVEREAFESLDLLREAKKILESLRVDILNSLDTIPNSNALPSVIKKYSKTASKASPKPSKVVGGPFLPLFVRYLNALAGFQIRCLEFRELIDQYAEAILSDLRRFTLESNYQLLSTFVNSVNRLKGNFLSFKSACEAELQSLQSRKIVYTNCLTIFMQTTFLHTLEQQNDCYLTRLQSGVDLLRAHCKFVWYQNEANKKANALVEEIRIVKRTTTGCRI